MFWMNSMYLSRACRGERERNGGRSGRKGEMEGGRRGRKGGWREGWKGGRSGVAGSEMEEGGRKGEKGGRKRVLMECKLLNMKLTAAVARQ